MNTFFNDIQMAIHVFRNGYSLEVSKSFIECADLQLTELFIKQTGLHPGKNVCITIAAGKT